MATKKGKTVYKARDGTEFRAGDKVRLHTKMVDSFELPQAIRGNLAIDAWGRPRRVTKIVSVSQEAKGLVFLENKLSGYYTWDVNDLRKVL